MKNIFRFRCDSVTQQASLDKTKPAPVSARFTPVFSNDPNSENRKFWDSNPSGIVDLTSMNGAAKFTPGNEYYIEITEI